MAKVRNTAGMLVVAVVGFLLGFLVFSIIKWLVETVWGLDGLFSGYPPLWVMVAAPVLAGVLVWLLRRKQSGHDPMAGLSLIPVKPANYPYLVGAVAVGLTGGLVLGPEVAMLFTGGLVAGVLAPRLNLDLNQAVSMGGLGALLALFVGPAMSGSTSTPHYSFDMVDVAASLAAGVAAVAAVAVARFLARVLDGVRPDDKVVLPLLVIGGLAVGLIAAGYQQYSGQSARLVLTSGEQMIKPLLELSAGVIAWTVVAKIVAYGISMGAGFRGGPYFPAMFAGAGMGAIAASVMGASMPAAATAGLLAATAYLAHVGWLSTLILGIVLGFLVGGLPLVPLAVLGALIGRVIPRVDLRPTAVPADA
ncbi:MAG: chloride channel protein [Candidatus Nanopelagicales bacterium]